MVVNLVTFDSEDAGTDDEIYVGLWGNAGGENSPCRPKIMTASNVEPTIFTCLASIQASGSVDRSERRLARRTNFPMKRVNHSVEYKSDDGACTNQAESYFSRLRRAEIGIHHHIGGQHLGAYSNEMV